MKKFTSERARLISFILNFLGENSHQPEINISPTVFFLQKMVLK